MSLMSAYRHKKPRTLSDAGFGYNACNLSAETNVQFTLIGKVHNQTHELGSLRRLRAIACRRIPCLETVCRLDLGISLRRFFLRCHGNHSVTDVAVFFDQTRDLDSV